MDYSMSGFPVHHQLLELAQTHSSSQWCHPTISSSVPFSSCLQSFPSSGLGPVACFFYLIYPRDVSISINTVLPHRGITHFTALLCFVDTVSFFLTLFICFCFFTQTEGLWQPCDVRCQLSFNNKIFKIKVWVLLFRHHAVAQRSYQATV